jgi:hypothetical protein
MAVGKSNEEKAAMIISKTLAPVDLDLDEVGYYLAQLKPAIHYNRLIMIAEAAVAEKESENENVRHDWSSDTLF